jgi:hypothetical protein
MRRWVLAIVGLLVVVLVAAQLLLPGLAARKLRSDLEGQGSGVTTKVEAFPAIKLLAKRADRVDVRIDEIRPEGSGSGDSLADRLASTDATDRLDVRIGTLEVQLLLMTDVRLHKDGDALTASVRVRRDDVDAALPPDLHLVAQPVGDEGLQVAGVTEAFGRRVSGRARVLVDDRGRIVLRPAGVLGGLVSVPIFSDSRIAVDAITARKVSGGFQLRARAHLR